MSLNNKRTAFARVPRGANSRGAAAPATFQVNKQFLDRMVQARLAPDMATVLTKSAAELSINVQPNGSGNFSITSGGRVIGDSSDVQKVQSLGSFINDERKAIVKTNVTSNARKTLASVVATSREPAYIDQVPRPIVRIDKTFIDVFRGINAQADMLNVNLQQIAQIEATGENNLMVRNHLIETGSRIREIFGKYLFYRGGIAETEQPSKLNDFLNEGNVISWVFTRLCSQKLQLGSRDFEYRKLYFPKDPTKGISVTFQEISNDNLLENQGGILLGMSAFQGLWTARSMRTICGVPGTWDLSDFAAEAKVFKNVPIMVVPPQGMVSPEEFFTTLNQHGERGLPWNVGNTITPQDTLKFLGTIPKRIAYGFLGRPRFAAPFYETLFAGFVYDYQAAERDSRSVYSQMLTQFRANTIDSGYFSRVLGGGQTPQATAGLIIPLVLAVMDSPATGVVADVVTNELTGNNDPIPNGEIGATLDIWGAIASRRDMDENRCEELLQGILAVDVARKSKSAKTGDIRTARSGLSAQGASLVRELKRRGYGTLALRVDQWMRSFLSTELQGPVAEVIAARLEASLATPIQFGRGDTVVFLEPTEFAAADSIYGGEDPEEEPQVDNPDDE